MKYLPALAAAVAITAFHPALAETTNDRMQKAPTKTLGDEGKLPPTDSMSGHVPNMTGPGGVPTPGLEGGGPAGPKGPAMRMGDEGKLPATGNMSGQVPRVTGQSSKQ